MDGWMDGCTTRNKKIGLDGIDIPYLMDTNTTNLNVYPNDDPRNSE